MTDTIRNTARLDAWITGNYGEDHPDNFEPEPTEEEDTMENPSPSAKTGYLALTIARWELLNYPNHTPRIYGAIGRIERALTRLHNRGVDLTERDLEEVAKATRPNRPRRRTP